MGAKQLITMRFDGTIKSWDDVRGFGFIEPAQGGQDIFVHIKAFNGLRERPQAGQQVSFEIELGPQGKKRAVDVKLFREPALPTRHRVQRAAPAPRGAGTLFTIPAFSVVLLLGYVLGHPPRWLPWCYLLLSGLTFMAYAFDKSAARKGAWRTSEQTLHLLALFGGWPGALLAQQMLRHKSSKREFRSVFWLTVGLNVLGFVFIASPYASELFVQGVQHLSSALRG
jgi:uncharacterized membrane protein YsdA (DUF1294 family)/cold shock CspA family protein